MHELPLTASTKYGRLFKFLNLSIPILMGIFIFCNPFPHTTAITNVCFYLAILIALVLIFFKRHFFTFNTPLTLPLLFFLFWSFLSILWSLNVENTLYDVRGHLLNYIVFYFLLINSFNSRKRIASLAWIVVSSALSFSIIGMIYYYFIADAPIIATRFGHLLRNSVNLSTELPVNLIGTLTVFAMLICVHFFFQASRLYHRAAIVACMIPLIIATLLTQSKGTLLSLLISITILLFLKARKTVPFFLLAIMFIVFLTPTKVESLKERLKIDYVTYQVIKDYPIKGIGFGMHTFINNIDKESYVNRVPEKYRPTEFYTPHNLLLDITVRIGLIGLLLFLYIIIVFGMMCWETIRHARDDDIRDWARCTVVSFVAYFTIGMAEPVFLFSASAIMFYVILAIITILWRLNQEERVIHDKPDTANNTNN